MRLYTLGLFLGVASSIAGCQRRAQQSHQPRELHPSSATSSSSCPANAEGFGALIEQTSMSRTTQRSAAIPSEEPPSTRSYPGALRVALASPRPRADVTLGQAMTRAIDAASATKFNLRSVSELLYYSYGETGGKGGLRAAASAGALYPTDVFLSLRGVDGVADGFYYYDPHRHDLVRVATAEPASAPVPPLTMILGASTGRTAFKYGARAARYVPIDVGHVAANALLSAAALGLGCSVHTGLDERNVKGTLGLVSDDEGVILGLECGAGTPASTAPRPSVESLSSRDLFETIAARRSVRQYGNGSVSRETLDGLLSAMTLATGVTAGLHRIQPWAFVHRVAGLSPGLYRYDVARFELVSIRKGDFSAALADAGLGQAQLARAAFVLAWAPVEGFVVEHASGQDFRAACLETGTMGELAYLAASALQLRACGVGAFYDDDLGRLFGETPRFPLYLMAVGTK